MLMFCYCGFRVEINDENILFRQIIVFKELTMKSSTDVEYFWNAVCDLETNMTKQTCMMIMDSVCI